jgi:hypothetical protein
MPFFKSTYNILTKQDENEVFNVNWMDSDKLVLPPNPPWDYSRELTVEDVDIWEVIYEASGGWGVYAAWCPHAEFYLITTGIDYRNDPKIIDGFQYWNRNFETFYGPGAQHKVQKRMKELNIPFSINKYWVEDDQLWLYQLPNTN